MKSKLIVGNRRFQVDEISKVELIYYECEYIPSVSSNMRLFAMPKVSDEISAVVSLEHMTENTPDLDPLICATFWCDGSELSGIRFQVPAKYFHSFKKISTREYWKKVDYTDDFFICSCQNVLVLRNALMNKAGRVDNGAVELTFKFEHYETFPIQLLDKVIERSYEKKET
nr:MAG TPA: hypothetical protein [Caudoviricetes sp.]